MKVVLTISDASASELEGLVAYLKSSGGVSVDGAAQPSAKAPAPARTAAPVKAMAAAETPKAEAGVPTLEDVKGVIVKATQAKKHAEIKALFAEFGAAKASELKEENYAEFIAKASKL
jgi:hypothetical protein